MGGCVSLQLSCDQVLQEVSSCSRNHLRSLKENINTLRASLRELKAQRDDMLERIGTEERTGRRQRVHVVQEWISTVQTIENRVDALLDGGDTQIQQLCLCGYCSKKFVSSYRYAKEIAEMCKVVDDLKSKGAFDEMTRKVPTPKVEMIPCEHMVGREKLLELAWKRLRKDGVRIFGLYGMGGVGKTTLLKHINRKFKEEGDDFDILIWVVVSKNVQISKIQEDIGEKLGLNDKEWNQKMEKEKKASDIYNALIKKRFVLLLDDLWSKVNLTEIGVPFPDETDACKVIFTTRSQEVCGRMGADDEMEVQCLSHDDALKLFRKKVGENTLESDPDIPELSEKVVRECCGLPLALNVIGETMARKRTIQDWHHAIDILKSSAAEFKGMGDDILLILKYSYDDLMSNPMGEEIRFCFLYCALFPEDYEIEKDELVDYFIGEGIIYGKGDIKRAQNVGHSIISTLVDTCLLMKEGKNGVKMHDVVREMALWVASDMGKHEENFKVEAGAKLYEMPKVMNWNVVRRMSLMCNRIEETSCSPQCSELETLFLQENRLVKLTGDFFRYMPRLLVLDLSENKGLNELPEEISDLVSLRYLNLSSTKIKRLPSGFQRLKKLIHLNVEWTTELESIHGVSGLSSLQVLKVQWSGVRIDLDVVKDLQLLEHLNLLTISMCDYRAMKQLLNDPRLGSCTRVLYVGGIEIEDYVIQETGIERRTRRHETVLPQQKRVGPRFSNLCHLAIVDCRGARDLTWLLLYAPNLVTLWVYGCEEVEEIISEEKAEEASNIIPFGRLEELRLEILPELKSIYWTPLRFPCFKLLSIKDCPKLRKLPFNCKSVPAVDYQKAFEVDSDMDGRSYQWEDEATQLRFAPFFNKGVLVGM